MLRALFYSMVRLTGAVMGGEMTITSALEDALLSYLQSQVSETEHTFRSSSIAYSTISCAYTIQ